MHPKMYAAMMASTSRFPIMCQIDGDGGSTDGGGAASGNGDGTSGDGSGAGSGNAGPDWNSFIGAIDTLNSNLGGKLDAVLQRAQDSAPAPTPDPEPEAPPNFDEMTNAEIVAYLSGSTSKAMKAIINEALAPVIDRVNGLTTNITQTSVNSDIVKMREDNKDFDEWHDEMIGIAKDNPTLNVARLYRLAKAENPAKAEKLAVKYAPPPAKKPNPFGGFGPSPNGKDVKTPVLSALEASREAYREVAERHPGILPTLSE